MQESSNGLSSWSRVRMILASQFLIVGLALAQPPHSESSAAGSDTTGAVVLAGVSSMRASAQLPALEISAELSAAAQARVDDMLKNDYFGLRSPEGKVIDDWVREAGYAAELTGEKLVRTNLEAAKLVEEWAGTPSSHRQSLLHPEMREVGIGIGRAGEETIYLVVLGITQSAAFERDTAALSDSAAVRQELLERVNQERDRAGLHALKPHSLLDAIAQRRARDYLAYLSGTSSQPPAIAGVAGSLIASSRKLSKELSAVSYRIQAVIENAVMGPRSPEAAVRAWMESEDHRKALVDRAYLDSGIGFAWGETSQGPVVVWIQILGVERGEDPMEKRDSVVGADESAGPRLGL